MDYILWNAVILWSRNESIELILAHRCLDLWARKTQKRFAAPQCDETVMVNVENIEKRYHYERSN